MTYHEFVTLVPCSINPTNVALSTRLVKSEAMAVYPRCITYWRMLKQALSEWRRHARSRAELVNLSDKCLQDIGLSRCPADRETYKPFWMG
jgi:uncharacterized protein YjiS (DUF1127 family)